MCYKKDNKTNQIKLKNKKLCYYPFLSQMMNKEGNE